MHRIPGPARHTTNPCPGGPDWHTPPPPLPPLHPPPGPAPPPTNPCPGAPDWHPACAPLPGTGRPITIDDGPVARLRRADPVWHSGRPHRAGSAVPGIGDSTNENFVRHRIIFMQSLAFMTKVHSLNTMQRLVSIASRPDPGKRMTTTKNALVRTLLECGAPHAFTLPGLGITWMLDEFHGVRDRLRVVLTRSEQIASVMAQVYGRLTGRPGVFMGQGPFAASTGAFG